jgi:hypothetical protein
VCKAGEASQRVRAGDTVWVAPNERHWHGATASTLMSHTTTTIGATEFHEAVTEAEYATANAAPRDKHSWQLRGRRSPCPYRYTKSWDDGRAAHVGGWRAPRWRSDEGWR